MSEGDLELFALRLEETNSIMLPYRNYSPEAVPLRNVEERRDGIVWLTREVDLLDVRLRHVETQGYWVVDAIRSPVVEFIPGSPAGGRIASGRLYYNTGYFGDDRRPIEFPDAHVRWAEGLASWIRKNFRRDKVSGFYDGPGARALIAQEVTSKTSD